MVRRFSHPVNAAVRLQKWLGGQSQGLMRSGSCVQNWQARAKPEPGEGQK
jgi:hypothetical protein